MVPPTPGLSVPAPAFVPTTSFIPPLSNRNNSLLVEITKSAQQNSNSITDGDSNNTNPQTTLITINKRKNFLKA
jgi:hypothetical protein